MLEQCRDAQFHSMAVSQRLSARARVSPMQALQGLELLDPTVDRRIFHHFRPFDRALHIEIMKDVLDCVLGFAAVARGDVD